MFVKPAPDVNVRDPENAQLAHLPPEGREVPESSYWLRRIRSGDVVIVAPPADPQA